MDINTLEIAGLKSALKAVYLSYNKEPESCSQTTTDIRPGVDLDYKTYETSTRIQVAGKDIRLLSRLARTGDAHAKPLRGVVVWAEINAPIYFWYEMETHIIGHQRLMSASTMHTEARGLHGEELQKVKAEIPMGHMHKKIDFFSYQTLRNIYKLRHDHRLPEWHQFCDWIRTLPFADELILTGLEDK